MIEITILASAKRLIYSLVLYGDMPMRALGICAVLAVTFSMVGQVWAEMPAGNMGMPMAGGKPMPANLSDTRTIVPLTEEERVRVVTDMRQMLANVQGIIDALARGDNKAVAQAASRNGMAMMQEMPAQIRMKFPPAFPKIGMPMHDLFDQIAREAETTKGSAHILKLLSESMQSCVACHATYRFASPKR
jgi:hypothetical protein